MFGALDLFGGLGDESDGDTLMALVSGGGYLSDCFTTPMVTAGSSRGGIVSSSVAIGGGIGNGRTAFGGEGDSDDDSSSSLHNEGWQIGTLVY